MRDLAIGLMKRGHAPTAYSTQVGDVAHELRAAGVPVVDDLDALAAAPEIIHGHHHLETMTALLRFPETPAIYVCHGATAWEEAAPQFPRILRYVAVDQACRDRLVHEHAIPEDRIRVVLNFVDLQRFKPRAKLPARPQRALIFSNQANEYNYIGPVRAACDRAGIRVEVLGKSAGNVCARPEAVLADCDIVLAKGRAALESLTVGAAVILCDAAGAGPMVTTSNMERLRPLNFGIRALRETVTSEAISREIACYDPADAARVSEFIRASAGLEPVLDELLALYQDVIEEHHRRPNDNWAAEQQAAAAYLRELAPGLKAMSTLKAKEAELEMIKKSRSWRMISRYTAIKHRLFPATHRNSELKRRNQQQSGEREPASGSA